MYSVDTVLNYYRAISEAIDFYKVGIQQDLHVAISDGNSKIGDVLNVSLPAIVTCGANCSHCMGTCYDIKACMQYKNVMRARARNYVIWMKEPDRYFNEIDIAMNKRRNNKYLRFHVSGDIPSYDYFDRMVNLARNHPDFTIWTYTKQYDIVNGWVSRNGAYPSNLVIMYSQWPGLEMVNPHGAPEFRVVLKGQEKPKGNYCPGDCNVCMRNHSGCIGGQTMYCNEH